MAANLKQKIAVIKGERDQAIERQNKVESKLQNENARLEEAERELDDLNRRIQIIEGDLEEVEMR